jgi:leucyl-tRNA synthetase
MEYVTALLVAATEEDIEVLARVLSPLAPHLAEAIWERVGNPPFVCTQPWPDYDPGLAVTQTVTVAVQVNGKLRGTFDVARGTPDDDVKTTALALPNVVKHMAGKPARRVIVVKGELVNIVV